MEFKRLNILRQSTCTCKRIAAHFKALSVLLCFIWFMWLHFAKVKESGTPISGVIPMLSSILAAETIIRNIGAINKFTKIFHLRIDRIDVERSTHILEWYKCSTRNLLLRWSSETLVRSPNSIKCSTHGSCPYPPAEDIGSFFNEPPIQRPGPDKHF